MSDKETMTNALQALANSNKGKTKTGRLRELLPQIEATHVSGVSLETILDALNEQGFDLTYKVFATMLWRLRRQAKKAALVAPGPGVKAGVGAGIKSAQTEVKPPSSDFGKKSGEPKKLTWDAENNETPEW